MPKRHTNSGPSPEALKLPSDALRWTCPTNWLPFASTAEVEPLSGIVGQEEALEALRFGLEMSGPGQNIFVREHYTLGASGRAASVDEDQYRFGIVNCLRIRISGNIQWFLIENPLEWQLYCRRRQ